MKISNPIKINIIPPTSVALFASLLLSFFPRVTPAKQIMNVMIEIMAIETKTAKILYSANVKPTESASIEVAMP